MYKRLKTFAPFDFLKELDILSRLSHDNIVRVLDVGVVEGKQMALASEDAGLSLSSILYKRRKKTFPLRPWASLTLQLLHGLSRMHSMAVLHTDLKPVRLTYDTTNAEVAPTMMFQAIWCGKT